MLRDMDLIVHKLGTDLNYIHVYPLGDVHIGSDEFDIDQWDRWKGLVKADPKSHIVIVGDLLDNGLKNSKTNAYEATMRPREQKRWLYEQFKDIGADKILGGCRGNHEYRSVNDTDDCPMYDVMCKLDVEDRYRENMAFVKVNLGEKSKDRQYSYTFALTHGAGRGKTENFSYAFDGVDIFVTGHLHTPLSRFPAKIVVDNHNEIVRTVGMTHVSVPSFTKIGGYALKGLYMPNDYTKIPVLRLDGEKKDVNLAWM